MAIETLRDVLNWTETFHKQLNQCLSQEAETSTDERAKMVLNYLADHEAKLTKVIESFEHNGKESVLNTWCYEYVQKYPITRRSHGNSPFSELDAEQIMDVVIDQHLQVIELYRYLASRAETASSKEMLDTLSSLEEHEIKRMVQSTNRFSDM